MHRIIFIMVALINPVYPTHFTPEETAIIMGLLLGDGTLQKRDNSYRLRVSQCSAHAEYVEWLHTKLARLCTNVQPPQLRTSIKDGKAYESVEFYLDSTIELQFFYDLFYIYNPNTDEYVKTITPRLIAHLPLNPLVLAVWYMDDGSHRRDANSGRIASEGFTLEGNQLLAGYLAQWGILATTPFHSKEKNQHYLSLLAKTFVVFKDIIRPIVNEVPVMAYKLHR